LLKKQGVGTDAMTSPDINGGTIDGATIGGSSGVTIGVSDGTVSAPSIKFTSDTNTGIYRGGTDILKFVTAGTDAITINASQQTTFAGNIDVTGTVTADGLILDNATGINSDVTNVSLTVAGGNADTSGGNITLYGSGSGAGSRIRFRSDSTERMRIENNGDISFYEDTGSTPKLFWDASEEQLGIGTASPATALHVKGTTDTNVMIVDATGTSPNYIFDVRDDGASKFRVDSSGNIGIGAVPNTSIDTLRTLQIGNGGSIMSHISSTNSLYASSNAYYASGWKYINAGTATEYKGINGEHVWSNASSGSADGAITWSEAMRIDSSGNVGIGTTSPNPESGVFTPYFTVKGGSYDGVIQVLGSRGDSNGAGVGRLNFLQNANTTNKTIARIMTETEGTTANNRGGRLMFFTKTDGGTVPEEACRLDSDGNLLVATTATLISNGGPLQLRSRTGSEYVATFQNGVSDGGFGIRFLNVAGSVVGSIAWTGSVTNYNTSSDHRLKENVTADWDATTRLKQLNPVRFNFIANADTTVDGFLAHEVQSVVPEAITGTHNEVDADGNPVYQGIDQSKLVPLLVKTIQELEARITALENG